MRNIMCNTVLYMSSIQSLLGYEKQCHLELGTDMTVAAFMLDVDGILSTPYGTNF
jgi:hypothetical protein